MHDKALALPVRSLDLVDAKAWQTLAIISLSVHSVRSTKMRLSLSNHARSTVHYQAVSTDFDHDAPTMQHPVHVRHAVQTALHCSTYPTYDSLCWLATTSTHLRLTQRTVKNRDVDLPISTDLSFPQRSSSSIQADLSFPQRPSSCIQTDLSCPKRSSSCIQRLDRPQLFQRSSSCIQRLDRPQLPATIIQLHSTTQPTSASRNDRPAASNDSTDLSYQ